MNWRDEKIKVLEQTIAELLTRIAELERRLNLNSSNSGKPPSSDGLRKKQTPQSLRAKGKLPSGGQNGHKGSALNQAPTPNRIIKYEIEACARCQANLTDKKATHYIKRQVFDIPQPLVEVTEHQACVKVCTCGYRNIAAFPAGVTAPAQYGKHVKTLAVYLNQQQLIPEDRLQELFQDIFKIHISTATLVEMSRTFSDLVKPIQERVLEKLKAASVKNADETGIRIAGKTEWLHGLSNKDLTHYRVSPKRGSLLDGFSGTIVHDHWKPYFKLNGVKHALCNAHHLRDLKSLEEIEKEPWAFKMAHFLRTINHAKDPPIDHVNLIYDAIVAQGLAFHESQPALSTRKNKRRFGHNLLLRLRDYKDAVLRFLTTPGVPFTNNQAEQDIRMMKVKQKISGCFRTTLGAEIFCIIRGFISTCRKQKCDIFNEITQAFAGNHPGFSI